MANRTSGRHMLLPLKPSLKRREIRSDLAESVLEVATVRTCVSIHGKQRTYRVDTPDLLVQRRFFRRQSCDIRLGCRGEPSYNSTHDRTAQRRLRFGFEEDDGLAPVSRASDRASDSVGQRRDLTAPAGSTGELILEAIRPAIHTMSAVDGR